MLSSSQGTKTQPLPEDTLDPLISSNPTMHISHSLLINLIFPSCPAPYASIHYLLSSSPLTPSIHMMFSFVQNKRIVYIDRLAKNNNKRIVYPASICLTKQPHVVLPALLGLSPPRRRLGYTYELTHFSHFNYQAQMGLKKQNKTKNKQCILSFMGFRIIQWNRFSPGFPTYAPIPYDDGREIKMQANSNTL